MQVGEIEEGVFEEHVEQDALEEELVAVSGHGRHELVLILVQVRGAFAPGRITVPAQLTG